jgi:hypothetical protein
MCLTSAVVSEKEYFDEVLKLRILPLISTRGTVIPTRSQIISEGNEENKQKLK